VGFAGADVPPAALAPFQRLAVAAADLLRARAPFGDTLVRAQRRLGLSTAAELQYSILPPLSFASRDVTVSAALEPCYNVAGDAIDYAVDDGRTRLAIFDGMGHGLHSAQCAVLTVAAYRAARRSGRSLGESFQDIDEALGAGMQGEIFTTAVLAELDSRTGSLRWVNAGHPAPLLLRGGRVVRALETDARPPLGLGDLLGGPVPEPAVEQLEPGDIVLLYTDGVTEARSPSGEFFGVERLGDLVIRHLAGGLAAPETLRRVVRELLAHHDDQLTDDATLLMLEWRSATAAPQVPPQPRI
jgi:serine phosphatase RsbU (regulator of sigma subunit)